MHLSGKHVFINTQGPARVSMDERFRGWFGKYDIKRKRMKNWGKTGGRLRTDRQRDKHETPSRTSRGKLSLNDGHSWFLPNANVQQQYVADLFFCWSPRCHWFSLCQIALLRLFTLLLICWIRCIPTTMGKLVASIFNTEAEYEANVFVHVLLL